MKCIYSVIFAALLCAALPLQADDDKKVDAELILGEWKRVEMQRDGKVQTEFDRELIVTFTKETVAAKDGTLELKILYKLDPTQTPKHCDFIVMFDEQTITNQAIYTLEGDTLKICRPRGKEKRPTEFQAREGDGQVVTIFERVKANE